MKKAISLILALVMCLSLCACGDGEQNNDTQGNTENPTTNDMDNSSIPDGNTPSTPTENTETTTQITIEITTENWSEYFELVESVTYHTNDFGDFSYAGKRWDLVLKKEYSFPSGTNYKIAFEVEFSTQSIEHKINHDTKEVIAIGEPQDSKSHKETVRISRNSADWLDNIWWGNVWFSDINKDGPVRCLSDFQVLRVGGDTTIELVIISE